MMREFTNADSEFRQWACIPNNSGVFRDDKSKHLWLDIAFANSKEMCVIGFNAQCCKQCIKINLIQLEQICCKWNSTLYIHFTLSLTAVIDLVQGPVNFRPWSDIHPFKLVQVSKLCIWKLPKVETKRESSRNLVCFYHFKLALAFIYVAQSRADVKKTLPILKYSLSSHEFSFQRWVNVPLTPFPSTNI